MQKRMAFKFELRPNKAQSNLVAQFAGARRFVFNKALDTQIKHYATTKKKLSYAELCKKLTLWKTEPETKWLGQMPSQSLQQALNDLDQAYSNFFKKTAKFPTFKKKGKSRESFRFPQGFKIDEGSRRIFLPKIGWVRYYASRKILGEIKNVTVSTSCSRCFVSIQTEQDVPVPEKPTGEPIALDKGIACFAALNDGRMFNPLNIGKKTAKKLAKAQRVESPSFRAGMMSRKPVFFLWELRHTKSKPQSPYQSKNVVTGGRNQTSSIEGD